MIVDADKLKRSEKLQNKIPKITGEDREIMKNSLNLHGQLVNLVVRKSDMLILDGYQRDDILTELGVKKREIDFNDSVETDEDAERFIIENTVAKRNLNPYQRGRLLIDLVKIEKRIAKLRQKELGKTHGEDPLGSFGEKGTATEIVSKRYGGFPIKTLDKIYKIEQEASPTQKQDLELGIRKISGVYNELLDAKKPVEELELPEDVWNAFEIDPPWRYGNKNTGGSMKSGAAKKYPTMSLQELEELGEKFKKITAKNAICYMWAVTPLGKDCQRILEGFGFKFKTKLYWIKTYHGEKRGMGYWYAGEVEEVLVGIRGKVKPFRLREKNYFVAPAGEHSEKPDILREIIERSAPISFKKPKYISVFSRKERPGWTSWGFDVSLKKLKPKKKKSIAAKTANPKVAEKDSKETKTD